MKGSSFDRLSHSAPRRPSPRRPAARSACQRFAARPLVCLLVVAMLMGLVPDVALVAAMQEGENPSAGTDAGIVDAVDDGGAGFATIADAPFTTASVLANDTDTNGDALSVVSIDTTG